MKKLIIYPGSFNPFHYGHLNVIEKVENIFKGLENTEILVAIGINPLKNTDVDESLGSKLSTKIGRKVEVYKTFLHEFITSKEELGYDVILIRGLRNGDDLSYEDNQLKYIDDFKPGVKSLFIMCDKEFEHISSSSIRLLESFRSGSGNRYIV